MRARARAHALAQIPDGTVLERRRERDREGEKGSEREMVREGEKGSEREMVRLRVCMRERERDR
jgi:hypothetical protein